MISALLLAAALQSPGVVDWSQVDINIRKLDPALTRVAVSSAEVQAIRPLLIQSLRDAWPGCGSDGDQFAFFRTPLGPEVFKAEAGSGGCRGGQGSNGALWLIRRTGSGWRVLASPGDGFNGWGLGVQAHRMHGMPDLVTGWHMGADDFDLTYFSFDGRRYRKISGMQFHSCSENADRFCMSDGRPARDSSRTD